MSALHPNFPRCRTSHQRQQSIRKAQMDGFKMAILAGAVVLNDMWEVEDKDITQWINDVNALIGSISDRVDDPKYLIRELEALTGIEFEFTE